MQQWLDGMAGPGYASAILWTLAALLLLVVVLLAVRLVRSLTSGTFVVGGRNRKTRLAVMDATAVDSHRRLVLVRRDDIEHLLLIGGPTDLVVERDIRLVPPRRAAPVAEAAPAPPRPRPPQPLTPAAPQAAPQAPPQPTPAHPQAPARPHPQPAPAAVPPPTPPRPAAPPPPPRPPEPPRPPALAPAPVPASTIDDTLMRELEVSLDDAPAPPLQAPAPPKAPSLDDEMARLLGELSSHKPGNKQ